MEQQLDRISLDDLRVTVPSGKKQIAPHKGQSVWVYPYGRPARETEELRRLFSRVQRGDVEAEEATFDRLSSFAAGEIVKWDLVDYRSNDPYPQPDSGAVFGAIPDEPWAFIVRALLGIESEGEGSGDSDESDDGSSDETSEPSPETS